VGGCNGRLWGKGGKYRKKTRARGGKGKGIVKKERLGGRSTEIHFGENGWGHRRKGGNTSHTKRV